jgi:hypothetical protein
MLNFFKSLYKKLYLFLLAPIENWLFTIKKDNGMYYFRYVCYRFVHYCLYLVCWYIFLSHIDYFYHFRVYQVFWLGHLLYWAYPYNNWDCEKFGPGWEFSGTLWDENALGDDGVVLEVFGDRILDYVWFLFIIW